MQGKGRVRELALVHSLRKRTKHGKKRKKSRLLDFEKRKKRKKNVEVITYMPSPEDYAQ